MFDGSFVISRLVYGDSEIDSIRKKYDEIAVYSDCLLIGES